MKLHIDIETYSSVPIKSAGAYKYIQSPDFEILLLAYAIDNNPVKVVDLAQGEPIPQEFKTLYFDNAVELWAHNATFERKAFEQIGWKVPIHKWRCSAILAAYCGLPLSLADVSKALQLGEKGKLSTGKALIRYFCQPVKATKANGGRTRNYPEHDLEKWELFKTYNLNDVEAEREISVRLANFRVPKKEWRVYELDQQINDNGVIIDTEMVENAIKFDDIFRGALLQQVVNWTGIENPNSPAQLKDWLEDKMQQKVTTLAKGEIPKLIEQAGAGVVADVLKARQKLSKSSTKKYIAMLACQCADKRAHGLFQHYGASRTGRWAGRLIQLQNLPQNHLKDLDGARQTVANGDFEVMDMLYDNTPDTLSQLVRTALIAPEEHTFAVADFSAIEARVLSWLAGEQWRMDVFATHGKIYEASASLMFGVPIEQITKGSALRQKGKVAELALGYQGAQGALEKMGGEAMGLSKLEMKSIVARWRKANPNIVKFWGDVDRFAKRTVKTGQPHHMPALRFHMKQGCLCITLPSGRDLVYRNARIGVNRFGNESISYEGVNDKKQWGNLETYGGKLTENIVQGLSRDLLAESMLRLTEEGFKIVMHVHDEAICEVNEGTAEASLSEMVRIMEQPVQWAQGLLLRADGYITKYYKKD